MQRHRHISQHHISVEAQTRFLGGSWWSGVAWGVLFRVFPLRHFSSLCTMASRKLLWKRSLKQNIHFTDKKKGIVCFYYLCDINTFLFERNLWLIYLFRGIVLLLSLWSLSNWIFKKNLQSVYLRWKLFFPFLWIFGICDNGKDDFRKYEKDLSLWGVEICASLTVS